MLLSLGRNLLTPTRASGEEVVPRYPHNTAHLVSVGDEVSPEQFIALVGKVGLAPALTSILRSVVTGTDRPQSSIV